MVDAMWSLTDRQFKQEIRMNKESYVKFVIFSQRPAVDGEKFYSRKGCYCINLQLFCDDRGLIRNYLTGWPGSVYDSTVFDKTRLCRHPDEYFSNGEFLMADSGYALKTFCLVPYRLPHAELPHNRIFNELFSSVRCKIEHVNGILKNRWGSLKGMPTQIKNRKDFELVNRQIVACLVLYNILRYYNDSWYEENDDDEIDEEVRANIELNDNDAAAKNLRILIQNECLLWHYDR